MLPLAPPRFSITKGLPTLAESACARTRPAASTPPPAGKGTIMRTGPFGYVGCAAAAAATATPSRQAHSRMVNLTSPPVDHSPYRVRRGGKRDIAHAEFCQRVDQRIRHRGGRRRGAAFAAGLDAGRIRRREHLDDLPAEARQVRFAPQGVIHPPARRRLARAA